METPLRLTQQEATAFFSEFYHGEHNIPGGLKEFGFGWCVIDRGKRLSTFDFDGLNGLTRLTIMAHKYLYRVEISAAGGNKIRIAIHKRQREGRLSQRHPYLTELRDTIDKLIEQDLPF